MPAHWLLAELGRSTSVGIISARVWVGNPQKHGFEAQGEPNALLNLMSVRQALDIDKTRLQQALWLLVLCCTGQLYMTT